MNGILIVDKPAGMSSFDVVRRVRRWAGTRRVGHAGTLDPFATGVLPIAIGQATRLIEYLMEGDKGYLATLRLGISTTTQDLQGDILVERDWQQVNADSLREAINKDFVGTIQQVPPMYSAIKQNGQPLYKLARQGISVERQPREIRVDEFRLLEFAPPDVRFLVACSKGTYVRTLAHDLGERLSCGAHLVDLRRIRCGSFGIEDSFTLEALQSFVDHGDPLPLMGLRQALADWPAINVEGPTLERLRNGVAPTMAELEITRQLADNERVCLCRGEQLVALARVMPCGQGDRPKDFELLKVFPEGNAGG